MDHEKHEKLGNHENDQRLIFRDETFLIQGAIFEVSREMGTGFLEGVYHECLAIEFTARGIPFSSKPIIAVGYKGQTLAQAYIPDFLCFDSVVLELKVVREIAPEHRAQVINYLRATRMRLGLLVNFGCAPKARVERIVA